MPTSPPQEHPTRSNLNDNEQNKAEHQQGEATKKLSDDEFLIQQCSDYDALTAVWLASVRATHDFLTEEDVEFYHNKLPTEYMPHVNLFALKDNNGAWCAFIGLSTNNIEMLFVHPEHMGVGYGSKLLRFAIEERGIRHVDVNEQNQQALTFYLKHGFSINGRDATDGEGKPYPVLHLVLPPSPNQDQL